MSEASSESSAAWCPKCKATVLHERLEGTLTARCIGCQRPRALPLQDETAKSTPAPSAAPTPAVTNKQRADNTGAILVKIAGVFVLIVIVVGVMASNATEEEPSTPQAAVSSEPVETARVEREPTYSPDGDNSERENAAMRAVYDLCSRFAVWREGTRLSANFVKPSKGYRYGFSNVDVHLAREATVANGHMLPYRIDFDKRGKPVAIYAWKPQAAELCGLDEHDVTYKLADLER